MKCSTQYELVFWMRSKTKQTYKEMAEVYKTMNERSNEKNPHTQKEEMYANKDRNIQKN